MMTAAIGKPRVIAVYVKARTTSGAAGGRSSDRTSMGPVPTIATTRTVGPSSHRAMGRRTRAAPTDDQPSPAAIAPASASTTTARSNPVAPGSSSFATRASAVMADSVTAAQRNSTTPRSPSHSERVACASRRAG